MSRDRSIVTVPGSVTAAQSRSTPDRNSDTAGSIDRNRDTAVSTKKASRDQPAERIAWSVTKQITEPRKEGRQGTPYPCLQFKCAPGGGT